MHVFAGLAGFALIAIILGDAFETIVLPRRVTRKVRFTRLFYRNTWRPWRRLVGGLRQRRRRETLLSFFGPLSLIFLLLSWAILLILGFALLHWAVETHLSNAPANFVEMLYFSGTTFTTLGLGDVKPISTAARLLAVTEAGTGFGFLAVVIGYLPVIYQAFSHREARISLLDARAGSPPVAVEMFGRLAEAHAIHEVDTVLRDFELWAAELLESHISYPVLTLFRSQHNNESWVSALTAILDACTLLIAGIRGADAHQAQLTFAMARHAAVDLAQILATPPLAPNPDRLPASEMPRLRQLLATRGVFLLDGVAADAKLAELRHLYEPYLNALANYLLLDLPPWFPREGVPDNWQTSAWERAARRLPAPPAAFPDEHV